MRTIYAPLQIFASRYSATKLQEESSLERYIPICYDARYELNKLGASVPYPYDTSEIAFYDQASAIVSNYLPVLSDNTPWEAILEFRSDPETMASYFALRDWISQQAQKKVAPIDIQDHLEFELAKIEGQLRRLK